MKKPSVIGPRGWLALALVIILGVALEAFLNRGWIARTYESYTKPYPVPTSEPARPRQLIARSKPAAQIRPPATAAPPPARSTACAQSSDHRWRYFGKAPFASSREEGMANREAALRCLGLPSAVIVALMDATKHPAKKTIRLAKGDRVVAMASRPTTGSRKGDILVERRVLVDFVPTGTRGIGFYAKVEVWSVSVNGTVYTIGLPEVCNNWLIVSITPEAPRKKVARVVPVIPSPQCVEVMFNAPVGGEVRWGVASAEGALPPSACNAQRQGTEPATAWYGECDMCTAAMEYLRRVLGVNAEVYQKFLYSVRAREQVISFSTAIWSRTFYACLYYPDGSKSCGEYVNPTGPGAWANRSRIVIPDDLWEKDGGRCPQ